MFRRLYIISALVLLILVTLVKIPVGYEYELIWFLVGLAMLIPAITMGDLFVERVSFVIIVCVVLVKLIFSPMFMSDRFVDLVEKRDNNMSSFNTKKEDIRRVTLAMALQVSNKVLGVTYRGTQLSSQYEMESSTASVQEVNGKLYWIIPLDYAGITKWFSLEYIPGYIRLSATDPKGKPELVLGKEIIVSMGGYFGDSIERKVWLASNLSETETHLEIDDKGDPYYISVVVRPKIGFSADDIDYIIMTNAQTGEMERVEKDEMVTKYPWVDRVWPERIVSERIRWFGSLKDGFINKVFTGRNVAEPTKYNNQELWLVRVNERLHWFTGMTSTNYSDKSLVYGVFALSGSDIGNNKKPIINIFSMSMVSDEEGAIEAIDSALGANSIKWNPVLPQPYIVGNKFYWTTVIVSLTDIFQKIAFMKGDDISDITFVDGEKKGNSMLNVGSVSKLKSGREALVQKMLELVGELELIRLELENSEPI